MLTDWSDIIPVVIELSANADRDDFANKTKKGKKEKKRGGRQNVVATIVRCQLEVSVEAKERNR